MISEIEKSINKIYQIPYSTEGIIQIRTYLSQLSTFVNSNHFIRGNQYLYEINEISNLTDELSDWKSNEDKLRQTKIQQRLANLTRLILDENKKIFIVHGRDIQMRDKVSSLLGKLKLDYVILESEYNGGATVIEKFLKNAVQCRYAIILFSGDDIGGLNQKGSEQKVRVRQNVILELGYFLSSIGRKNITILHDVKNQIEKPSDFNGFVYEPFDEYGAWKSKLIKEMRKAKIYVAQNLADRV